MGRGASRAELEQQWQHVKGEQAVNMLERL